MKVKLVSYSKSADNLLPVMSNAQKNKDIENLVAFCARVSNPNNQKNVETNDKLLKYLIKHKHWSPFEMVSICLEIETTRDIARQILRHRSFSFQEFSQRYADVSELGDMFSYREARLQDPKNRQNSISLDLEDMGKGGDGQFASKDELLARGWYEKQREVINQASKAYKWAIANGIAKEQARAVLPEGLTKSRMYMNGTLRSWIHYIDLRSENGTQREHIEIAKACAEVISKLYPLQLN